MKRQLTGDTKTYVEVLYPGILFSEEEIVEVKERTPRAISKKYKNAFAFQFFDQTRTEVELDGRTQTVFGDRRNESPVYYPGGDVLTVADVKKLKGDHGILISNMEGNGYKKVVRTRLGNFQPFNPTKDEVILNYI